MTYYGILKDDTVINNNNLSDLIQTPGLEYILKFDRPINASGAFTIINNDGTVNFLRIGDFELRNIGSENYHNNKKTDYRKVSIC